MKGPSPSAPIALLLLLAAACGGAQTSPVGAVRFHNREPVWVVNDRRDVPKKPEEGKFYKALYHLDGYYYKRIDRRLQLRPPSRAVNVNSLDEVPDSTWFTNRIGVREMTADEIARGPNVTGSPEDHRPWTIKSSKVGGITVGFIIKDTRGVKYVLKFDEAGIPEVETAADVILQRLLWACGYNVPEDYVVSLKRSDLVLADDAVIKDPMGNEKPMSERFVDEQLARVNVGPDGTIRGLVSQFIPGVPIGGHERDGVRPDDPNDTIPHNLMRELRGQYAIFSWLDQTDAKEDNSLDTWVEDPVDKNVHYVVHYMLDFGKGLGAQPFINGRRFVGHAYLVDFGDIGKELLALGFWRRPWENRVDPGLVGVGLLDSEAYDPGSWHAYSPSYFPFLDADRFDKFWGSKILIRFTRDHIEAAVAQARLSDPRAARYITEQLIARQRKTARYWFKRVNPLDRFEVRPDGRAAWTLCFDDLAVRYNLEDSLVSPTRYAARTFDFDGRATGWRGRVTGSVEGRTCLPGIPPAAGTDAYTIVELRTSRPGLAAPATLVHVARDPKSGAPRVIGLRRL
ncbi:MAG TPA: hypothetical protein VFU21_12710 [Kofleriaceae bacterium]|nr:hypothetical protein [Kofleriaceae bacterium]